MKKKVLIKTTNAQRKLIAQTIKEGNIVEIQDITFLYKDKRDRIISFALNGLRGLMGRPLSCRHNALLK